MDDITFHIVANDLTSNSKTIIFNQVKNSKALVSFYTVPSLLLEAYKLKWGHHVLSMTVFYRCLLATILPETIEKVVYMDCDVLVLQSLRDCEYANGKYCGGSLKTYWKLLRNISAV